MIVIMPEISLTFKYEDSKDFLTKIDIASEGGSMDSSKVRIFFFSVARLTEQELKEVLIHRKVKIIRSHIFHQTQILAILKKVLNYLHNQYCIKNLI